MALQCAFGDYPSSVAVMWLLQYLGTWQQSVQVHGLNIFLSLNVPVQPLHRVGVYHVTVHNTVAFVIVYVLLLADKITKSGQVGKVTR